MPWALAKDPDKAERLSEVLYNLVESISIGANLLNPFLPETASRVLKQLNAPERELGDLDHFGAYSSGTRVTEKPEILFARIDPAVIAGQIEAIEEAQRAASAPKAEAEVQEIDYSDFEKLDLRLAKVTACEEVKRSKKLLKLTLEVGAETRTVVSGIKNFYKPEDLLGKTVVLVANLKPIKLCGIESHGMILCASDDADSRLSALTTLSEMESGLKVR